MTALEAFKAYPKNEDELTMSYFERLAKITGLSSGYIRKKYYINPGKLVHEDKADFKNIKHGWRKIKGMSYFFTNPDYEKQLIDFDTIDWQTIFETDKKIETVAQPKRKGKFDRLVYTDVHVGMEVNKDGIALYGGKWDEEEVMLRLNKLVHTVLNRQKSNTLIIDDLGDLMDGWNAKTVRNEHDLPQNMSNEIAFETALKFKVEMIKRLHKSYKKIICHNITNDNHSSAFGYVVNSAFKHFIEQIYSNVKVTNYRKFINHYKIGNNTFIVTHGKDKENMKIGFKPILDARHKDKINSYIDSNYLLEKGVRIEFSKGDSHQCLFDMCSSNRFDYFNYPAFSPASNWVQTNFSDGRSGFWMFNYLDTFEYEPYGVWF